MGLQVKEDPLVCTPQMFTVLDANDTYTKLEEGNSSLTCCNARDPGLILAREDPLEKEMATHPSILAWKTPWKEEPGRLVYTVKRSPT